MAAAIVFSLLLTGCTFQAERIAVTVDARVVSTMSIFGAVAGGR